MGQYYYAIEIHFENATLWNTEATRVAIPDTLTHDRRQPRSEREREKTGCWPPPWL